MLNKNRQHQGTKGRKHPKLDELNAGPPIPDVRATNIAFTRNLHFGVDVAACLKHPETLNARFTPPQLKLTQAQRPIAAALLQRPLSDG